MLSLLMPTRNAMTGSDYSPLSDFWYGSVGRQVAAGVAVTNETSLTYSAVWAATRLLSGTAGRLPLNLYRRSEDMGKAIAKGDPRNRLVSTEPNSHMIPMMWKSQGVAQQVNAGNSYSEIQRGRQGVIAFWPIHYSRVKAVINDETNELYYRIRNNNGTTIDLPSVDVLHFPSMMSEDGITGKGVLAYARETVGTGLAAVRAAASTFGSGGLPRVVIESPKKWSPESRQNFRKEWKEIYGGPEGDKVGVMDEGSKLHPLGVNYRDLQFLELQQNTVEDVARWYGVPQHKIQHLLRCMPADTLVFTEVGPKRIADIETGERVWSETDGGMRLATVTDSWQSGVDEVLTFKTTNRTVRANRNHRMLVRRKVLAPLKPGEIGGANIGGKKYRVSWVSAYVPAGELRVGDTLVTLAKLPDSQIGTAPNGRSLSVEFMEFAGLLIGDGNVIKDKGNHNKPATISIARADTANYMDHYRRVAKQEFVNGRGSVVTLLESGRSTKFRSTVAAGELTSLGLSGTAFTKRIPGWIFGVASKLKFAFLRGFLDADGTVDGKGRIVFYSANKLLINDVRHLCMSVGVPVTNVRHDDQTSGPPFMRNVNTCRVYRFTCSDPGANRDIGSHDVRYQNRLASGKPFSKKDRKYPRFGGGIMPDGTSVARIKSIDVCPAEPVYDLQVDGTQNFVADGVVVHNSTNNNIEQQGREFIDDGLMPWLVIWEEELDRKLLTEEEQGDMFFAFNVAEYLRGDTAARSAYHQSMVNSGIATRNEARIAEDLNPVEGGDTFLVQGAMVALDEDGMPQMPAAADGQPAGVIDDAEDTAITTDMAATDMAGVDVQATALNGAQIVALVAIATSLADEQLPKEGTRALIEAAFPAMDRNLIDKMVEEIDKFTPKDQPKPAFYGGNSFASNSATSAAKEAVRSVLQDTLARMIHKEATAARRAANKPGEFLKWMDEFYVKHQEQTAEALAFAERAAASLSLVFVAELAAARLCEQSKAELLTASETTADKFAAAIEKLTTEWETNRAAETVRAFFERSAK